MILYTENPKDSTQKLLDLKNSTKEQQDTRLTFSHWLHFYTKNQISEKGVLKKLSFKIASKKLKYLGINLTKEVKDL